MHNMELDIVHPDTPTGRLGTKSIEPRDQEPRNNFRPTQSAEKLLEKYNSLAKEAMSLGDKTLCENYLQHADHFMRVVEDKSKNKDQSKANIINKSIVDDKRPSENSEIKQEDVTKNQE